MTSECSFLWITIIINSILGNFKVHPYSDVIVGMGTNETLAKVNCENVHYYKINIPSPQLNALIIIHSVVICANLFFNDRDGATISKVGGLNFLWISSPTFWVTLSYTWTKLKECLKSPSIRKWMPYLLFLSINTTLTTSPIVFNYRRFPWYQGTNYFCWKCIPKNTSLWEIMNTMIFTRYWIYIWGTWKHTCNTNPRNL